MKKFTASHKRKLTPLVAAMALAFANTAFADKELGEVTVTSGKPVGAKPILRDEIIATESIGAREIERVGATTLVEGIDKRPGISVQTECAICNVRNIVLNNLPGRYTTLLIDGIPIFSSVSSAYGLDSVSLGGLERIDISRGAGTSLIAPEALAGAVNIVTRRPTEDEFLFRQQFGSYGSWFSDLYGAKTFEGGALSANFSSNNHETVDYDGNRVSEYTGYRRNLGGLGFFLDDVGGFKIRGRLDLVDEDRMGGAMGRNYDAVKRDTSGNPFDWSRGRNASPDSRGWVTPDGSGPDTLANGQPGVFYDGGRASMSEIIFTNRTQFVTSATRKLGEGTMRLAFGYANHRQDSFYEGSTYKADQDQYYLEASTQQPLGETLVTAGLSYRYEDLNSRDADSAGFVNDGIDNYDYRTPGVFLQAYRPFFDGELELNASIRYDHNNVFGSIFSPRVNALWNHNHELNSRFAVGTGYRAPTSFFEQDHGILDTTRIVRQIDEAEISENASYALSYAGERFASVASLNYNRIKNVALLDSGQCEDLGMIGACTGSPSEQKVTLFTSAQKPVTVYGGDIIMTYKITPQFEGSIAAEHFNYSFSDPGALAFARPETRAYWRLDY